MIDTTLVHQGNSPTKQNGYVSPPIYKGSTFLYDSVAAMEESAADSLKLGAAVYGRFGTPNSRDLETVLAHLEGGFGTVCTGTGLGAITTAILSFVKSGDHILVSDSVYAPTRRFCNSLARFGVRTEYYDPCIGEHIRELFQTNTRLVFMESPGSCTFEIQDVPAIARECRMRNIISMIDNTWATPLFFNPLRLGVNISIHSATKYITGHADSFLGAIVCDEKTFSSVRLSAIDLGQKGSPEDIYSALRGIKTLGVRLRQHDQNARELATWLLQRPEVDKVMHPALTTHPGHKIWKRDFSGAAGLFSFQLKACYQKADIDNFINSLKIFGIGHSWGGFESLMVPVSLHERRSLSLGAEGALLRVHVGLENVEDLKHDIDVALRRQS